MSAPALLPSTMIYHLKVVLMDVAPTVWRRFQAPASMTLADLRRTVQIVMGWDDWPSHQFYIAGETYGPWHLDGVKDDRRAALGELVPPLHPKSARSQRPNRKVRSVFGYEHTPWQHEIRVEKVTRPNPNHRYPRCVAGAWGAPPSDCGGPAGYLRIDRKRNGDLFEDFFDVDEDNIFDVEEVNEALRFTFKLELEPEPQPNPTPRDLASAPTAERPVSNDRVLPEPFETLVRAREGRATPEQEKAALSDLRQMLARTLFDVQYELGATRSLKTQELTSRHLAEGLRAIRGLERRIDELEEAIEIGANA